MSWLDGTEQFLTDVATRLGPWLAPVAPAYFIARAAQHHLAAPWPVALVMAISVETVGIATTHITLKLYNYNNSKRARDPRAPLGLAIACAGVYLLVGIALSTLLEVWPSLAPLAPPLFFLLAGAGYGTLALAADQSRREGAIAAEKAARRAARAERRHPRTSTDVQRPESSAILVDLAPDPALDGYLEQVAGRMNGSAFGWQEVGELTGLGRSKAYEILAYAQQRGQIEQISRGKYRMNGAKS